MNAELRRQIAAGPGYFPHTIDPIAQQLLMIEMDARAIADASFLDQRILTATTKGGWAPLDQVAAEMPDGMRDDAAFLFHIGHCGSTLISRLLDAVPGVLGLREPQSLRDVATMAQGIDRPDSPWSPDVLAPRIAMLRRLLSRTFSPEQRAVVKPTSFVSEIAPALMMSGVPAAFLYLSPERYFETILAGDNSRAALGTLSGPRLNRLHARIGATPWQLWRMDEGARIALAWAVEMAALVAAARALPPERVLWVDFDAFLADPAAHLTKIAGHFDHILSPEQARAIVAGPEMRRYSKATEHAYSPQLRSELLHEARRRHGETIRAAQGWLDTAAREFAPIKAALDQKGR